jgi:16S rRNA (cytidine1402-2'-O)-methyltransferase
MSDTGKGCLYLCATPIGNLEDITLRCLRILKEADYIAAEDTRHTLKLLNHYGISKPLISYHEHNRREKGPDIIALVKQGNQVALVSDAGNACYLRSWGRLVQLAYERRGGCNIVPGPSAALSALALSTLSTERFAFEGFLPRQIKKAAGAYQWAANEERTVILYEAPHRLTSLPPGHAGYIGESQNIHSERIDQDL